MGQDPKRIDPEVHDRLRRHEWPGNVRELRNLAERLAIVAPAETIRAVDLPPAMGGHGTRSGLGDLLASPTFQEFKNASEAAFLQAKLLENEFNVSKTAEQLEMQRSNLYKKIQRYGLRTSPDGSPPGPESSPPR
jgi:two-component system nitrogen regulation response regulator NtrX